MNNEEILSQITIVDDFFPPMIYAQIKNHIFNNVSLSWAHLTNIGGYDKVHYEKEWLKSGDLQDSYGFFHEIDFEKIELSFLKTGLQGFLKRKLNVEIKEFIRSMAVILPPEPLYKDGNYMRPHVDLPIRHLNAADNLGIKNLLYYMDDSDGDTLFFDHYYSNNKELLERQNFEIIKRVTPKKNRLLCFDSWILHAPSVSKCNKRCTLNFVIK